MEGLRTTKRIALSGLFLLVSACSESEPPKPELSVELQQGKTTVQGLCINCHGQGVNNAPILGNPKMWGKRITQGEDTLVSHALNGFNMMPPRGGNPALSDEEIRHAVQYMMSLVVQ